ncbi:MAG: hypothetical protein ACRC2K_13175 [Clostridium sp.]
MSWDNIGNENQGNKNEIPYVKFPQGQSIIRILDDAPYSRWTHWLPQANGGKGLSIDCIGKTCPVCKARKESEENKSKYSVRMAHSINVLVKKLGNETKNEVMVFEGGNGIFSDIKNIMTLMEMQGAEKDLTQTDIIVMRSGEKLSTKYSVMIMPPFSPLTEEQKALDKYNTEELKPLFTAEQISGLMAGKTIEEVVEETKEQDVDFTSEIDN